MIEVLAYDVSSLPSQSSAPSQNFFEGIVVPLLHKKSEAKCLRFSMFTAMQFITNNSLFIKKRTRSIVVKRTTRENH